MIAYDGDVKKRLGNDAWELLIQYVNDGKISSQHSSDIARLLAERIPQSKIFGAHKNRMKDSGWNHTELRHILGNWYSEEMFELNREEALSRLADIFEDPTLGIRCLASEIRKFVKKNMSNNGNICKR